MKTVLEMVREFHEAMGLAIDNPVIKKLHASDNEYDPTPDELSLMELRSRLINEEWDELEDFDSYPNMLKEMADLVYVIYGAAVSFGLDLDEAVRRVHQSNMSKLVDGKPIKDEGGKVLKGPNYKPPVMEDLIA